MFLDTPNKKKGKNKNKKKKKNMQNIRITHYEKQSEEMNSDNIQPGRVSMKTPPNYQKASSVFKETASDIQNNNVASQIDYSDANLPSSSNGHGRNIVITRQSNMGDVNDDVTLPETKDCRLIGFEDFNHEMRSEDAFGIQPVNAQPHNIRYDYAPSLPNNVIYNNDPDPVYTGYYNSNRAYYPAQLQTVPNYPTYYQPYLVNPGYDYYDRVSSHRNHPYRSSYDDRMVRRHNGPFQNGNPGPLRRRKPRYRYRR